MSCYNEYQESYYQQEWDSESFDDLWEEDEDPYSEAFDEITDAYWNID